MTTVTGHWIEQPQTQEVCRMLTSAGYRALFVGGCVRNALLGEPVNDIDISTDAVPERVVQLAEAAGLKAVPTGIDHGTVTVVADHVPHEVTTFRRDVETDGRRAVVAYTDKVEQDALRRDFTMNALYARADGSLVDPLGGLSDLQARRVLFIEDPAARIREDFLRILRFFRFYAWYGDPQAGIDPEGLAACARLSRGLETLSIERITAELLKLLSAPDPAPAVASMTQAGILARVLPGSAPDALPMLVALEASVGVLPDGLRRLAALGGEAASHLRLSKPDTRRLETLLRLMSDASGPAEIAYRQDADTAQDTVLLRAALLEQALPPGFAAEIAKGSAARFPVKSADLMPDYSGAALGARLKRLEQDWIDSDFALTRGQLLA
ncbi:MAG: CCA tRNA nucleotidyltransferase [Rhodobacter sp.]|nr:CCA tRNA nucleotidyltransferase [Rhodobacter sp.]